MTPEQAAEKYHWIKYDKATNTVEMYLDNFMLSGSRICESMFYLEHLLWIQPKYEIEGTPRTDGKFVRKPWFLDFGEYIHWCLDQFYKHQKLHSKAPEINEWLLACRVKWDAMKMDEYKNSVSSSDVNAYEAVKGWEGVAGLLAQYYAYYLDTRLRIIDTEIVFGHNKEVCIGKLDFDLDYRKYSYNPILQNPMKIYCYLTGRIDLLVDNGNKIGPIDHKTTAKFDGFEHEDFNPHDGICGYILAVHEILNKYKEQGLTQIPECHGGWINHISATIPSQPRDKTKQPGPRFKTTPIDKSNEQLEDYKARQLSSFKRIAELLFNNKSPEWNTTQCNSMFFRKCKFKTIHEQPSSEWAQIIQQFYTIGNIWDTREYEDKK
jgi:hypothetical protein